MANYSSFKKWVLPYLDKNLSPDLVYHGLHHTKEVLENTLEILDTFELSKEEVDLLKTAVLLHDSGFVNRYSKHEEEGCIIARDILPHYNYSEEDIETICGMIMATRLPQRPNTKLERIIADADLMYIGTDKYTETAETLYDEMKTYSIKLKEEEWIKLQISFLETHSFHTEYCINKYQKEKFSTLEKLKNQQ